MFCLKPSSPKSGRIGPALKALSVAVVTLVACTLLAPSPRVVRSRKLLVTFQEDASGIHRLVYDQTLDDDDLAGSKLDRTLYGMQATGAAPLVYDLLPLCPTQEIRGQPPRNDPAGVGHVTNAVNPGDFIPRPNVQIVNPSTVNDWPRQTPLAAPHEPALKLGHFESWLRMDGTINQPTDNKLRRDTAQPVNGTGDVHSMKFTTMEKLTKKIMGSNGEQVNGRNYISLARLLSYKKVTSSELWRRFAWEGTQVGDLSNLPSFMCHGTGLAGGITQDGILKKLLPILMEKVMTLDYKGQNGNTPIVTPASVLVEIQVMAGPLEGIPYLGDVIVKGIPLRKLSQRELYYTHNKIAKDLYTQFMKRKRKLGDDKLDDELTFSELEDFDFSLDAVALGRLFFLDMIYAEAILPYLSEGMYQAGNGLWYDRLYPDHRAAITNVYPRRHHHYSMINGDHHYDFRYLFLPKNANCSDITYGYYKSDDSGTGSGSIKKQSLIDFISREFRTVGTNASEFNERSGFTKELRMSTRIIRGEYRDDALKFIAEIPYEYKREVTKLSLLPDILSFGGNRNNLWVSEGVWAAFEMMIAHQRAKDVIWRLTDTDYPGTNGGWFDEEACKARYKTSSGHLNWNKTSQRQKIIKQYTQNCKRVFAGDHDEYDDALKNVLLARRHLYDAIVMNASNANTGFIRFWKAPSCIGGCTYPDPSNNLSCVMRNTCSGGGFLPWCQNSFPHDPRRAECEANRFCAAELTILLHDLGNRIVECAIKPIGRASKAGNWTRYGFGKDTKKVLGESCHSLFNMFSNFFEESNIEFSHKKLRKLTKKMKDKKCTRDDAKEFAELMTKYFKEKWTELLESDIPEMCKNDKPLTDPKLNEADEIVEVMNKPKAYYRVVNGSKKARKKRLCAHDLKKKELTSSEVAGPKVGTIVEPVEGSETKNWIRWRHKNGKEYYLPIKTSNLVSKNTVFLEKLIYTCGQRILLKGGKNATIETIEEGNFIVRLTNGKTKSVTIDQIQTGIAVGVAVTIKLNNKRYKNKKAVVMKKHDTGMWVVQLMNGKELLLRENDMEMFAGVIRSEEDKKPDGKTPSDKPSTESNSIYVPPPPGVNISNQKDAMAYNAQQMQGGMSKGVKLGIVVAIVIVLLALLGGAYMFMGKSKPRYSDIERPSDKRPRESRRIREYRTRKSRDDDEQPERRSRSQPRRSGKSHHHEREDREERADRSRSQGRKSHRESRSRDISRDKDYRKEPRKSRHSERVSRREDL